MKRALVRYSPPTLEDEHEKLKEANAATELELSKALRQVDELKRDKIATANAANSALEELAKARSKPDYEKRRLRQQLECTNRELASSQARLGESQRTQLSMKYELDALGSAFYNIASEKQMLELALMSAHNKVQTESDASRAVMDALFSEQKKNVMLEQKLLESQALSISLARQDSPTLPEEADRSQDSVESDGYTDPSSALIVLELELERDMYRAQEQEALEALATEKSLRATAEKDCATAKENEQLAVAAIEAHKMAYIVAEQDKMIMAAQLEDALSHIAQLTVQVEQGFSCNTQSLQMEVGRESLRREHLSRAVTRSEHLQIEFGTINSEPASDLKGNFAPVSIDASYPKSTPIANEMHDFSSSRLMFMSNDQTPPYLVYILTRSFV